jgi:SUN domain-containing protein 1/2
MHNLASMIAGILVAMALITAGYILYQHELRIQSLGPALDSFGNKDAGIYSDDMTILQCKAIAEQTVQNWSKDVIARQDFALARSGALIVPILTHAINMSPSNSGDAENDSESPHSPWRVLEADLQHGSCWRFEGSHGYIGVALPVPVVISHITIDHIPRELTLEMGSAPRSMVLWGLIEGEENIARHSRLQFRPSNKFPPQAAAIAVRAKNTNAFFMELASFEYDITQRGSYVQTFPIYDNVRERRFDFGIVLLEMRSNWDAGFTCLYRMRIHGDRGSASTTSQYLV